MSRLPSFNSRFLDRLCRRLEARTKTLKHRGSLTWELMESDEPEWINVYFTPLVGNYCIFQFVDRNVASIFIRSRSRKRRGKYLLEIPDLLLVDDAVGIVEAIEMTIAHSYIDSPEHPAVQSIRTTWSRLQVRLSMTDD